MNLKFGTKIRFEYDGMTAEGTVISAGPKRVHVQSGNRGVYISRDDVVTVLRQKRDDEIPLLGERLRIGGGLPRNK